MTLYVLVVITHIYASSFGMGGDSVALLKFTSLESCQKVADYISKRTEYHSEVDCILVEGETDGGN